MSFNVYVKKSDVGMLKYMERSAWVRIQGCYTMHYSLVPRPVTPLGGTKQTMHATQSYDSLELQI